LVLPWEKRLGVALRPYGILLDSSEGLRSSSTRAARATHSKRWAS